MSDSENAALLVFLIRAKKATYVGNGAKAVSSRQGAHDLVYEEGEFTYRDSYFGGIDFIGQEVVWKHGQPLWSMCYYGYILRSELVTPTQAGNTIKAALSQPEAQGRLLENLKFSDNGLDYAIASEGNVSHFKGRETIHANNTLAYALDYFGGLIKD